MRVVISDWPYHGIGDLLDFREFLSHTDMNTPSLLWRRKPGLGLAVLAVLPCFVSCASASFHFMQIEQVIGSLNGNPAAQAIQLRMRSGSQNLVSFTSLWAADAAGANRILLLNIPSDVTVATSGSRILLATAAFTTAMQATQASFTPDFTLATPIPASYLAAGRLTFEQDGGTAAVPGTIYWSLSWGGANYTGSNAGEITNDSNGNFGPPFGSALPASGAQGIQFTGAATALSSTNQADYSFTANPATVVKNSAASFTLPVALTALQAWRQTHFGTTANSGNAADDFDFDKDGLVNLLEFGFGLDPTKGNSVQIPQGQVSASNFTVSFTQPAGVSGITYAAESSATLEVGSWTPVADTGSGGQHVFSIARTTKGFIRLKVTAQ